MATHVSIDIEIGDLVAKRPRGNFAVTAQAA